MMIRHQSAGIYIYFYIHAHVQNTHTYNVKDEDVPDASGETERKQEGVEDLP